MVGFRNAAMIRWSNGAKETEKIGHSCNEERAFPNSFDQVNSYGITMKQSSNLAHIDVNQLSSKSSSG